MTDSTNDNNFSRHIHRCAAIPRDFHKNNHLGYSNFEESHLSKDVKKKTMS